MAFADQQGQELYCVALEHYDPKTRRVRPELQYCHADCSAQAEGHFKVQYPNRRTCKIVGAALAIGFKVDDNQGMKLSV